MTTLTSEHLKKLFKRVVFEMCDTIIYNNKNIWYQLILLNLMFLLFYSLINHLHPHMNIIKALFG